ncbi:MFS transporter [Corynebacterium lowii]|uniref:Inner membrane metabolite transport protein YhjE n=1 Tax=Corynebacterium lowii TaxID=1544413 RepID=A0A0Q0YGJ4_9CORY|nr:MFS transporter [Corynebacterium lowii]KQB85712.1 Inner membrane metabolite transport protein YhjE [Corynebacterium lowii]MDP9851013.1 metabolite-proton symporter [Corynebacterium lowii]
MTTAPTLTARERTRVITASTVGTTIEFYDFYVYATATVAVFPHLFFPKSENPTVGLLASFATFGLAFLARPLVSIIFGHFGDVIGRKATLVFALLTMGIATFLIGVLPTYQQVGIIAPALLALMRFCQGLGLGGEWSGAALLATETAEEGKRAWAAMWPQLGAPFGFLLANGLFLILVSAFDYTNGDLDNAFMVWGWRIPFLASAVMVAVGLYVRLRLEETPVFQQVIDQDKRVSSPLLEVFRTAGGPLVIGTFVMVGCYTLFYLVTTWILSYGIDAAGLNFAYTDFLKLQLISIFGFIAGVPLSGWLADKVGRKPTLLWVTVAIIVFSATFSLFLGSGSANTTSVLLFLSIGMLLMGLIFGPMSAVLPELFPTNVRYTGSGIAYNVASILGAAIAPFIATALNAKFGVSAVGLYLGVVSVISLIAIIVMHETREQDLSAI